MAAKAKAQITLFDITDAYSVVLTSEAFTFIGNTSGAPTGLSCATQAVAYCGSKQCSKVTIGTITCPTGVSATISNNGSSAPTITFKTTATITAACEATIPVTVDGVTINKKFSFAVAKTGATGATGAQGNTGATGPKGDGLDVKDTRNDNQPPSWYFTNYPKTTVMEFKYCSKIGLSGVGTYCTLQTVVPWTDASGGYPKQTAKVEGTGKEYWRVGTSASAWSSWVDSYGKAVEAAKTATNYMKFENNVGLIVGDMTQSTLGNNVLIDSDSVDIRSGSTVLASYGKDYVYLGKNSESAKIDLCSGAAKMYNEYVASYVANRFVIEPQEWLYMTGTTITADTFYDNASTYGEAEISLGTFDMSPENERITAGFFYAKMKTGNSTNSSRYNYANLGMAELDTDFNSNSGAPLQLVKGCSHENYTGETSIKLYNDYIDVRGTFDIYGTTICNGALIANDNINANKDIGVAGDMWFTANQGRFYVNKNGVDREAMNLASGDNGDMSIGWTNYDSKLGALYIGGTDIYQRISSPSSKQTWRSYYRKGDTVNVRVSACGYVTNGGKDLFFWIPLVKPIIGSPTVSITSINGLILRQNNSYPHSSSTWCKPASYTANNFNNGNGVGVKATFSDNTGVTNNSPMGVDASIKITFS